MPNYRYAARDERGNAVTGTLAAPSPEALADQLKRTGYLVTHARELAGGAAADGWRHAFRRVGYEDVMLFNVQLSKMIQVGIPLVTALDVLVRQTENSRLREALGDVARTVEGGTSFSDALAKHPAIFSGLFINMVRAGEASGKLDDILTRLAIFAKHQGELREQLTTALTYPILLVLVGIGAIVVLIMSVIPKFVHIFVEAGVPLPLPTLILSEASHVLRAYGVVLLAGVAAAAAGVRVWLRTEAGRRHFDRWLLRVPVLGDLVRKTALSRMARSLETLLSSGVPVLESLAIAEQTCGNAVIADACRTAQASVTQGGAISDSLKLNVAFPPMVVQMITVGEASGTLDHMLAEIADHYDELVRHGLKRVTSLVEPLFLIVMGGMVAFIMASVLLPLFRMIKVIHH